MFQKEAKLKIVVGIAIHSFLLFVTHHIVRGYNIDEDRQDMRLIHLYSGSKPEFRGTLGCHFEVSGVPPNF